MHNGFNVLACVFSTTESVYAGALTPMAFSASTLKLNSVVSFRLSIQ